MTTETPTDLQAEGANQTSEGSQAAGENQQGAATTEGVKPAAEAKPNQENASGAEDSPKGETKPEGETEAPKGAPEQYEFKAPEGTQLAPEVVQNFSEVAKELDLTQEAAQKVVDKMAPAFAEAQQKAFAAQVESWGAEAKADKELGGDKFDENLALAKQGLEFIGTPELSKFLADSGLGNHPEVLRVFFKVGQAIKEDDHVPGSTRPNGKGGYRTDAERQASALYGSN